MEEGTGEREGEGGAGFESEGESESVGWVAESEHLAVKRESFGEEGLLCEVS